MEADFSPNPSPGSESMIVVQGIGALRQINCCVDLVHPLRRTLIAEKDVTRSRLVLLSVDEAREPQHHRRSYECQVDIVHR